MILADEVAVGSLCTTASYMFLRKGVYPDPLLVSLASRSLSVRMTVME